jgi:hypothetical protein
MISLHTVYLEKYRLSEKSSKFKTIIMSLSYISQQLAIYGGLCELVAGIAGNGMNIFIFSTVRNYRTTPSSFYFLVCSVVNIIYSIIYVTARVITGIYDINLPDHSLIWCKARPFLVTSLTLISFTCSCSAAVDQFFVTSQSVRLRRRSNIKWAHRIVFFAIIIWFLHGIPTTFYYTIPYPGNTCIDTNKIYLTYISIYTLGHTCAIPILVMVIFGWLTYRNIRLTRVLAEQHADRQLVKMTLIQTVIVVISFAPYGIMNAYTLITSGGTKSVDQQVQESFALTIFTLTTFIYYAVCLLIVSYIISHEICFGCFFREVSTCF